MKINLYELRTERKLTMQQLADKSGVAVSHIHYIENGERSPTADILCKLAKALEVEIGELVSCDD